jgi:hypothetical protein
MYSTCLFCCGKLGTNDMIERFPIGGRLAFDSAKGRLWVVCTLCRRWNLAPIEERFETVEDCERLYRGTRVRVSTENIGLAKMRDGLELVRIGAPLRPEFAAWRYASEFFSRRNRSYVRAGATVAGLSGVSIALASTVLHSALTISGAYAVIAVPALAMGIMGTTAYGGAMARDYMRYERIIARFKVRDHLINVRAKHAQSTELGFDERAEAAIGIQHDGGSTKFTGGRAMQAASVLLASSNKEGASSRAVQRAVDQIEAAGDSSAYLTSATRRSGWRSLRPLSVLGEYRGLGPMNLNPTERLALEMAIHEESERRAFEGELAELRAAWLEAEEIASIVDGDLTPLSS